MYFFSQEGGWLVTPVTSSPLSAPAHLGETEGGLSTPIGLCYWRVFLLLITGASPADGMSAAEQFAADQWNWRLVWWACPLCHSRDRRRSCRWLCVTSYVNARPGMRRSVRFLRRFVGRRSFPVAASILWNNLPPDIQSSSFLTDFCHIFLPIPVSPIISRHFLTLHKSTTLLWNF